MDHHHTASEIIAAIVTVTETLRTREASAAIEMYFAEHGFDRRRARTEAHEAGMLAGAFEALLAALNVDHPHGSRVPDHIAPYLTRELE